MPTIALAAEDAVAKGLVEFLNHRSYASPRSINSGGCMAFADWVQKQLPDEIHDHRVLYAPGHTWIRIGDRHYDAEAPTGVQDWRDLPFFQRCPVSDNYDPEAE